jgi:hypothetical protein
MKGPEANTMTAQSASKPATIAFIVPWFGSWPGWMPAFLLTCGLNPDVTWIIPTDELPLHAPRNVHFVNITLGEISERASRVLGFPVNIGSAYKLCDFKPLYGMIFEPELRGFDFWGHSDLDILWGSVRSFITPAITDRFDVICGSDSGVIGHCTLYRNCGDVSSYIVKMPFFNKLLSAPDCRQIDELWCNAWLHGGTGGIGRYLLSKILIKILCRRPLNRLLNRYSWYSTLWGDLFFHPRKSGPGARLPGGKRIMIYNRQLHKDGYAMQREGRLDFSWNAGRLVEKNGTEWLYLHFQYHKKLPVTFDGDFDLDVRAFHYSADETTSRFTAQPLSDRRLPVPGSS